MLKLDVCWQPGFEPGRFCTEPMLDEQLLGLYKSYRHSVYQGLVRYSQRADYNRSR